MLFPTTALTLVVGLGSFAQSHELHGRADVTKWAPLPATAAGPTIPASGYVTIPLGEGAHMVTDGSYQALFFVSPAGVVVVDAPPTLGRNLLYAIGNTTKVPVTHVVYSHSHADHIGGAYLFGGAKYIAHTATAATLATDNDKNRPAPSITFEDLYELHIGNQTLQLSYKGPNHEPGNIFIYAPCQKILMLVDVIYPGWVPFSGLGYSQFIPGWFLAHDQVLEYDFQYYVGGHLGRTGTREDVEIQKEYINDLYTNCHDAILLSATNNTEVGASGILGPVLAENPGNTWAGFKAYLDTLSAFCGKQTADKWVSRLGAADVFASENAYKMVESLRIDFGVLGPFGVAP